MTASSFADNEGRGLNSFENAIAELGREKTINILKTLMSKALM